MMRPGLPPVQGTGPTAQEHRACPVIHLLRLAAAICIFAGHWAEPYVENALPQGQLAIDMFFMAEGFLAAGLLADGPRSKKPAALIRDRFAHIYPLYLASVATGFAAAGVLAFDGASGWTPQFWLHALIAGAAMLPVGTTIAHGSVYPLNPPSWAIILELLGFAALALVYRKSPRLGTALLWGAGTITLLALIVLWHDPNMGWRSERYWGGLPRMAFGFFGGAMLFQLHSRIGGVWQVDGGKAAGIALTLCCAFVAIQFLRIRFVAWPLLGGAAPLLLLAAAQLRVSGSLAVVGHWAGSRALAAYLLGYPVMIACRLAGPALGIPREFAASPAGFALTLGAVLLAGEAWVLASRCIVRSAGQPRWPMTAMPAI